MLTALALLTICAAPLDGGVAPLPLELGVDLHAHVSMEEAAKPLFHGRSGQGRLARKPTVVTSNQLEAEGMTRSGVRLIVGAVWPPNPFRPGRTDTDEALHQLIKLEQFPKKAKGFVIAYDSAQARKILQSGLIAVVPGVEGGEGIHKVDDVDLFFAAGARVLTIVHFGDNDLGTAAQDQLTGAAGFSQGPEPKAGLSALGREVIQRMIRLGMVIDLAHASDQTARDVLELTEAAGVPVLNTHTGSRELTPTSRNLSDALAKRIVAGGGIIGVTAFDRMVKNSAERLPHAQPGTCDDIAAHWLHFASVVGAENLVFGADLNGFVTRPSPGGACPEGIRHSGDYAVWSGALKAHGVPEQALHKMGERFLKLLAQVEAKADPAARAKAKKLRTTSRSFFDAPL